MYPFRTFAAVVAVVSVLAGCAALEPLPPAPAFELIGRVAVSYDGRAFSSGVRWQHTAERDELWLLTPAGQALAHVVGDADGALYTGSDRSEYRAGDIGSLIRRALGWELPVTRLAWWVQGELVPGAVVQAVERDQHGRLTVLAQEDWRIAFVYDPPEERGSPLRRLNLAGGSHEIRLVIDGWLQDSVGPVRHNP